jgi:hypothetical protein
MRGVVASSPCYPAPYCTMPRCTVLVVLSSVLLVVALGLAAPIYVVEDDAAATPPPPTPVPPPSTPPPPPTTVRLPPFPSQFTATYHKVDAQYSTTTNTTGYIYQDQKNQRCRMNSYSSASTPYMNIDQLAIYRPPNAQPNTAQVTMLTLFNFGPYGLPAPYKALYSSRTAETWFQSTFPFPEQWFLQGTGQPNVCRRDRSIRSNRECVRDRSVASPSTAIRLLGVCLLGCSVLHDSQWHCQCQWCCW